MTVAAEGRPVRRTTSKKRGHVINDYVGLSKKIKDAGLMRRRYDYYWTKLALVPVILGACVAVFIWIGDSWWQMLTAVAFAFVFTQIAFLGHDAAHRQIFRSGKWNDWTSLIIADLLVGLSYGWWQHKHTRHHGKPNQEGADPDIELPVIAVSPEQANKRRNPVSRWLTAHQGWLFFPILLLEGISLHASSVRRVFSPGRVKYRYVEILFLALRFGTYLALVFIVLSPGKAFAFLGIQLGLFGVYMGMSFAPNHKGMTLVPRDAKMDFLRHQALTSRNIRGNRVLDFLMGGLNYQVEHHLFPSMPRPHVRRAAPIVREYCRSLGIPYTVTGLGESYGIVVRYINRVGLGERDPFECPLMSQRAAIGD